MLPSNVFTPTNDDFDRFEERLLDTVATRQTQRRRRHRTVLAATAVLLAGAGGTAWVTLATPELQSLSTYCYADADTDADVTQVGSPTDQIAPDGTVTSLAPVGDPASAAITNCAAVWAIDLFGTVQNGGVSPLDESTAAASAAPSSDAPDLATGAPVAAAPRLQACLRPDGVYSVFPVVPDEWNPEAAQADDPDAFCATVGLQPPFAP